MDRHRRLNLPLVANRHYAPTAPTPSAHGVIQDTTPPMCFASDRPLPITPPPHSPLLGGVGETRAKPSARGSARGFLTWNKSRNASMHRGNGLPWREGILPSLAPQGAFPSQTQPARLTARGKAECLPSLRPSQCQRASPCSLPVGDPASSAGWRTRTEQIAQRVDAPWKWSSVEGRHSAFPGAARRLSFANAASAPDGAREGRMPSLLKALPMSGSQSLFPARRRPGALGGLQTRMEQIAQRVDAPWKWSSSGGRAFCLPWRRKAPFLRKRSQRA